MSNLWDAPPLTVSGDSDENVTYLAVGRFMTRWESLEFALARLYSVFIGSRDNGLALAEYGNKSVFRERLIGLGRAADAYFILHPNQLNEINFHRLQLAASGFSARRNDIAHGVVWPINTLSFFREKMPFQSQSQQRFAVIPPIFTLRRHDPETGMPLYGLGSAEIGEISYYIASLHLEISDYTKALPS